MTQPRTSPYMYVCHLDSEIFDRRQELSLCSVVQGKSPGIRQDAQRLQFREMEHGAHRPENELVAELEERGCELFIEQQNSFESRAPAPVP